MRRGRFLASRSAASLVTFVVASALLNAVLPQFAQAAASCTTSSPGLNVTVTCTGTGAGTVAVPVGATAVDFVVIGAGGAGGNVANGPTARSGSGASITGTATLPTGADTLQVVVGAGGVGENNVPPQTAFYKAGTGGGGSGLFAYTGNTLLDGLAIAGGGGGGGVGNFNFCNAPAGGNAGTLTVAAQPGVDGSCNSGLVTSTGGGAGTSVGGTAGTATLQNGYTVTSGTAGGDVSAGSVAAGGLGALSTHGGSGKTGGGGGGGYTGGGGGGSKGQGGISAGSGGGGGSSWVNSTYVSGATSTVVTSAGPGFGGQMFFVFASNGTDGQVALTFRSSLPPAAPDAPTGVSGAGGAAGGSIDASWTAPSTGGAVDEYLVKYRVSSPQGSWTAFTSGGPFTSTSVTITGLAPGTAYDLQVASKNTAGTSAYAQSAASATAKSSNATPPRDLIARTGSLPGTIAVSWRVPASDGGQPITYYVVAFRRSGSAAWRVFPHPPSSSTSTIVSALTPAALYEIRVAAITSIGRGEWASGLATAGPAQPGLPTAPIAVVVSGGIGAGSVAMSWRAPRDNGGSEVVDYRVEFRVAGGGPWTVLARPSSSATAAVVTGLVPGSSYDIRVAAVTSVGRGPFAYPADAVSATGGVPSQLDPVNPPTIAPRGSSLLVDGSPSPVTVAPNAPVDPVGLTFDGPGFGMSLFGRGDVNDPLGLTQRQMLVLQSQRLLTTRGLVVQPVAVSQGNGFMANSQVRLYILPDIYLGTLDTESQGNFQGSVPIPPGIEPGVYTLQSTGFSPDGKVRALSISVRIVPPGANARATATTLFAPRSAALSSAAKATLRALARTTGTSVIRVSIAGYASRECHVPVVGALPRGDMLPLCDPVRLSRERANAVAAYLTRIGVEGRFVIRGLGVVDLPGVRDKRRATVTVTYRR